MLRAKVFSRLERTHIPGRENSKSQGVAMASASGRGGSDFGGEIETYLHFIPEATSSPAVKE